MKKIIQLIVLVICGGCSFLFYQPSKETFFTPDQFNIKYDNFTLTNNEGKKLHGWILYSVKENKGTFVQFHGNAENISTHFLSLSWVTDYGFDLITFDYSGYGKSEGYPSQEQLNRDSLKILDYAMNYHIKKSSSLSNKRKFITYGQSLGGTILLRALYDYKDIKKVDYVVVDSSFLSYINIAKEKLAQFILTWWMQHAAYLLISDKYAPFDIIDKIIFKKILVIHGDSDHVIPIHFGEEIFSMAKGNKELWMIKGGTHINSMIADGKKYRKKIIDYILQ